MRFSDHSPASPLPPPPYPADPKLFFVASKNCFGNISVLIVHPKHWVLLMKKDGGTNLGIISSANVNANRAKLVREPDS